MRMKLRRALTAASREVSYFRKKHFVLNERRYLANRFEKRLGRKLDLKDPVLYNDKLQWLKLYWRDPLAPKLVDKYSVREYVEATIGSEHLNELLGVYNKPDEIDFDCLPNEFVLKATHGSGWNIICRDKARLDQELARRKLRKWLRRNAFVTGRSWVYKDIQPRIVCEKFLEDVKTGELRDYKVFCFYGKPQLIQVDLARFVKHKRNLYTIDWELMACQFEYEADEEIPVEKPQQLQEMLNLAEELASPFPHVRVDFYVVDEHIVFGEMTFFPESGFGRFRPESFELYLGALLRLPSA